MSLSQALLQFVPDRVFRRLEFGARARIGTATFKIPINRVQGWDHLGWKRTWMAHVLERLVVAKAGVFVDIGANIGQTLLSLQATHPEVAYLGIEPNPHCAAYLDGLIKANKLSHCTVIPIGLAGEAKLLPLYCRAGVRLDDCATIQSDLRPGSAYEIAYVPCFPFDAISNSLLSGPIGFLKIDVEGAELDVLLGCRSCLTAHRPVVLCEVLGTDSKANLAARSERNARLMDLLMSQKYRVRQLVKSSDNSEIVEAREIHDFPAEYYSSKNMNLCDYLFLPAEDESRCLRLLLQNSGKVG